MIGPYFDGGIVVELFGGSGALSLEALSRGAEKANIFEKNGKHVLLFVRMRKNVDIQIEYIFSEQMPETL